MKNKKHTHPVLAALSLMSSPKSKIVSAEEAIRVIRDGDTRNVAPHIYESGDEARRALQKK